MNMQLIGDLGLSLLCIYPLLKIFTRAGVDKRLAFFVFVPFFGLVITGLILSLSQWKRFSI